MNEMVNRVARAFFDARWTSIDNDLPWSVIDRTPYIRQARIVIEAMPMMNEMMLKIGRAIDQERWAQIDGLLERGDTQTAKALAMAEELRVVAVIMAIREPTLTMILAACTEINAEECRSVSFSSADAETVWRRMVDAMGEGA